MSLSDTLVMHRPTIDVLGEPEGNRQRFAIGPLEPGFGHTLGNSLRRTLLSSIPGAAITQVRFDDALHEFTTIAGVLEDVTDIILNLKDVVLRSHSDVPVEVRMDERGAGPVLAGHVDWGIDVECLTPDLHVATLGEDARLAMDLTVERGWGYAAPESDRASSTIGVMPIDALFSPVRRVAVEVEPVRVEQSTDFDRLVLDIETDGAMSPREALASAGDTLCRLMLMIAELSPETAGLHIADVAAGAGRTNELERPIEDLGLSERARNCLKRAQFNTIGELLDQTVDELMTVPNFGQKSLDEVIEKLDERGLALRGMSPSSPAEPDQAETAHAEPAQPAAVS
ncbi:DNA-directed RNA polymerase subunit alpha [Candidatus Poriferisodalis sp.]|uniref:DNA-directed RNA polymerase subunit alpha n=1 Tax=Candidatus Poriferisodalis sp. TaxID=3101277 RepID=UPI003B01E3AA